MFPRWPKSAADLVPLPRCDGPKMKPFDFQGPQKIEFLERLGEGSHSHVVKVKILGDIYALKVFRFPWHTDWLCSEDIDEEDEAAMTAAAQYSEPFYAECRAYGRLQETGYEELSVKCFGYVLFDEDHERALMRLFGDVPTTHEFCGNVESWGGPDLRERFMGEDNRPLPLRALVKEFGYPREDFQARDFRRTFRNIVRLQQLGIINIDAAARQIINDKIGEFSTAITIPHYVTTSELNPSLTPEMISAMEFETFYQAMPIGGRAAHHRLYRA